MKFPLPNGWIWARCHDVIDVRDGTHGTPKKVESGIPMVTSKNLKPYGIDFDDVTYISEEDYESIEKRSGVDDGDILFAMIGTIGNPVLVKKDRPFSIKNVALFKIDEMKVHAPFFRFMLDNKVITQQLDASARGGSQKFVSLSILRNMKIPLPPLPEQQRIAAVLDKAEEFRAKRRVALSLLDSLGQSIFLEMFGDPAANPKKWPTKILSELVRSGDTINYGVVQPGDDLENGVPLVRVGDLIEGCVRHTSLKQISPSIESSYKRSRLRGDEILVSCVGSIGVVALVKESEKGFNIARAVARIPLAEATNRTFMAAYLKSDFVQRYFTSELRTVSQPTLNIKQLSETTVVFPPLDLQKEFALRITAVEKLKTAHRAALAELDALFASLQHRAFRGEL